MAHRVAADSSASGVLPTDHLAYAQPVGCVLNRQSSREGERGVVPPMSPPIWANNGHPVLCAFVTRLPWQMTPHLRTSCCNGASVPEAGVPPAFDSSADC